MMMIRSPLTKATWCFEIKRGRITKSLLAKILKMILYEKLKRLIGQKSEKGTGYCFLGMRVRK